MTDVTGSIYYRFGSERSIWRELQIDSTGGVLVSDLKIMIAQETSLMREFAYRTNLIVSLYDENSPDELQQLDDNVVVHNGSRLIINRVAWTPSKPIVHEAKSEIETEVIEEKRRLKKFPISLICQLCHKPMNNPILVKCTANCGSSGCKSCLEGHFDEAFTESKTADNKTDEVFQLRNRKVCPFCGHGYVTICIPNRKMEFVLHGINLDDFEIPTLEGRTFVNFNEDDPSLIYPTYYLLDIDTDLLEIVIESKLIPIYSDSLLGTNVSKFIKREDEEEVVKDTVAIIISHIGGGTAITSAGIIKFISEFPDDEFMNKTGAHTALKFEWIKRQETPFAIPAHRQPLFTILGGKRCTNVPLNAESEVLWRVKNDRILEVGLDRQCYNSLLNIIFGDEGIEGMELEGESDEIGKNWLDICFPKGPPPLYISSKGNLKNKESLIDATVSNDPDDKVDLQNPYSGYMALLPFLSRSQFDQIRLAQRNAKELYLMNFTKYVMSTTPPDKCKDILERTSKNIWKAHVEYNINLNNV